jgi:hypothetical protein
MESPPTATFIISQPEFPFEIFLIALDDPAVLGQPNQRGQPGLRGQRG